MESCSTMKGDRQTRGTVPVDVCLFLFTGKQDIVYFSINKIKNRLESWNIRLYNGNRYKKHSENGAGTPGNTRGCIDLIQISML